MFKWFLLLTVVAYASADSAEHGVAAGAKNTSCKCGWANRNDKRIVGGTYYRENEYPFTVGLAKAGRDDRGYRPFCGGSIINPNHVITAAHCTDGVRVTIYALLGTHDRSKANANAVTIPVQTVKQHQAYNPQTVLNDISLLTLKQSINFNTIIGPVCLPLPGLDITGLTVRILGWGAEVFSGSVTLRPKKLDTSVITPASCAASWRGLVSPTKPTQICTQSKKETACQGDSGGPVVWLDPQTNRYTLVGLVSFGPPCTDEKPTVHTRVEAYLPWIQQHIKATKASATCSKV